MGLNLFKRLIKADEEKERILIFLNIANELYNNYNSSGKPYKLIPEVKETFFKYGDRFLLN